jgi:hypothetical protein
MSATDAESTPERVIEKVIAGGAIATGGIVTVKVQTRMLLHWSDVAIEQEPLAWAARRELEHARVAGKGLELGRELRPSLITVAAVSHALDALYGELRDLALPSALAATRKANPRSGPPRWRKLHETLKSGLRIPAQRWERELEELFELRDGVVHPETRFSEPEPHPLGVETSPDYVVYRCERASEAVDLLFEILESCVTLPKPPLEEWTHDLRPSLERLRADRLRLAA